MGFLLVLILLLEALPPYPLVWPRRPRPFFNDTSQGVNPIAQIY